MLSRRSLLLGGLATVSWAVLAEPAQAMVARALTLGELIGQSQHALVGTPVGLSTTWELVGRRSRIVTYTRVHTEYSFDGRPPADAEVLVRSLGGVVGNIGQVVPGEALLERGATAALFLHEMASNLYCVTGMSQGHYPVFSDASGIKRLRANPAAAEAYGPDAAVRRLDRRTLGEAEILVFEELTRVAR